MKLFCAIVSLCLCLAASSLTARSQQPSVQDSRSTTSVRIDTDLVMINVIAIDKNGDYVRDLQAEEFQVFEDGLRRRIDFFSVNDESTLTRPLAVVFALDLSGSLKPEEMRTLHDAAMKFTELMTGDSVFAAISFNDKVKVEQDFTSDASKIEKAFTRMNRFSGSTRLYDAIDKAVTMLNRRAPRFRKERSMRQVVIVITDGFDSASIIDRRELIRRANTAGVSVYSVTLPSYMLSPTKSMDRVITPFDAF
jgi:Ca-activated chloride channel homolog